MSDWASNTALRPVCSLNSERGQGLVLGEPDDQPQSFSSTPSNPPAAAVVSGRL